MCGPPHSLHGPKGRTTEVKLLERGEELDWVGGCVAGELLLVFVETVRAERGPVSVVEVEE